MLWFQRHVPQMITALWVWQSTLGLVIYWSVETVVSYTDQDNIGMATKILHKWR